MSYKPNVNDTIAAIATPYGRGGIAVIKISGPESSKYLQALADTKKDPVTHPREMIYSHIKDNSKTIDEALVCFMQAPQSYTGEDVVEIQCHGGSVPADQILSLIFNLGARPAEPGEFTKRAFLNSRIDLTQAEGVMEIVTADNREHLKKAEKLLEGELSYKINNIINTIAETLTLIEFNIEFSEEHSYQPVSIEIIKANIISMIDSINKLTSGYKSSKRLRNGLNIVLAGNVNSGKSSLFNTMTGKKRSIVHHTEGTTRDWIEERIEFDGIPINLIDTAGLRNTPDEIENEGIKQTNSLIKEADIVLYLQSADLFDIKLLKNSKKSKYLNILSKSDLNHTVFVSENIIKVSSKTGEGIDNLRNIINQKAQNILKTQNTSLSLINDRHYSSLKKASECLKTSLKNLHNISDELISFELTETKCHLENILGVNIDFKIVENIFKNFCIGK
jgi:tRNA modification GTPase